MGFFVCFGLVWFFYRMPSSCVVATEVLHWQVKKISTQCDLLSCDNDLYCCKHSWNTTCVEVFYKHFYYEEQANLGNMIIHSLIIDGKNIASLCVCYITKGFQKAWDGYTRVHVKWWKYKIVSMRVCKYWNMPMALDLY